MPRAEVMAVEEGVPEAIAGKAVAGKAVAGKAVAGKAVAGKAVAGKAVAGKAVAGKAVAGKVMAVLTREVNIKNLPPGNITNDVAVSLLVRIQGNLNLRRTTRPHIRTTVGSNAIRMAVSKGPRAQSRIS
jgi:ABC-type uncharacterized transport system permease subunit